MKRLALALMLVPFAAQAEVAKVRSGKHADFTRITVTTEQRHTWALARTQGGYLLSLGADGLRFDLTEVFRAIGHERLQSIWVEPDSGDLQLGLACACHIIPFEFSETVLVLDIKPGGAPENSIYETLAESQQKADDLAEEARLQRPQPRPKPTPDAKAPIYDWTEVSQDHEPTSEPAEPTVDFGPRIEPTDFANRTAFQGQLAAALSQAATAGYIQMQVPQGPSPAFVPPGDPQIRLALEALPQIAVSPLDSDPTLLSTEGALCPKPEWVTLRDWMPEESDPHLAMAAAKQAILEEFDQAKPDAIVTAMKTHLYFGFGAEALTLSKSFPEVKISEPLLTAIALLIDERPLIENPFLKMQSCGSAAALWALLATTESHPTGVNSRAAANAFRELPAHIKPLVGAPLAKALLNIGAASEAEQVRSALARATPEDAPHAELVAADIALHEGDVAKAEKALNAVRTADAESPENELDRLLLETAARHQKMEPLSPEDLVALQSFTFAMDREEDGKEAYAALSIALALAGDFDAAFDTAQESPAQRLAIWDILGKIGPETAVLEFAVSMDEEERRLLPQAVRETLSLRLNDLGLPNAALAMVEAGDAPLALHALLLLESGDAKAAVREATKDASAQDTLAAALTRIGAYDEAAKIKEDQNDTAASRQLRRWANEYTVDTLDGPWAAVHGAMAAPVIKETPLAAAQELLAQSEETRAAITSLLSDLSKVE